MSLWENSIKESCNKGENDELVRTPGTITGGLHSMNSLTKKYFKALIFMRFF